MFWAIISPILRSTRLCLQLVVVPAGDQEEVELEPVPLSSWSPADSMVRALYHKL